MGFFSQLCEGCKHPLLSIYSVNEINYWMLNAVAVNPNGSVLVGEYDGYGRINGWDAAVGNGNTVWHEACWKKAGCPTDYRGESEDAPDQGYFFNDEHDMVRP